MTGHTSVLDVLLVAVAAAALALHGSLRVVSWWTGPRNAASQRIEAGVAYLQSLPHGEHATALSASATTATTTSADS